VVLILTVADLSAGCDGEVKREEEAEGEGDGDGGGEGDVEVKYEDEASKSIISKGGACNPDKRDVDESDPERV
jgi:hypothetical protein